MTHPPIREGDFTFSDWIHLILEHCSTHPHQKVGVKLDFKDPPAVQPCLKELAQLYSENRLYIPLWVNADILNACQKKSAFNPDEFIQAIQATLPGVVPSLGWTTDADIPYTQEHISQMLELCTKHELKNCTFPMRASLVRASEGPLLHLLGADPSYSLTIWSGLEKFSKEDYDWIRYTFDARRIYLDITLITNERGQ